MSQLAMRTSPVNFRRARVIMLIFFILTFSFNIISPAKNLPSVSESLNGARTCFLRTRNPKLTLKAKVKCIAFARLLVAEARQQLAPFLPVLAQCKQVNIQSQPWIAMLDDGQAAD